MEPVGINTKEQTSFIETIDGKIDFNRWVLCGVKAGVKTKLADANWSSYTVGEDGAAIKEIFPGIDAELLVSKGAIKTQFKVHSLKYASYDQLILEDHFENHINANLQFDKATMKGVGKVQLVKEGKDILSINKAFMHPIGGGDAHIEDIAYQLEAPQVLGMLIPVSYLKKHEKEGVLIDPSVTTTTTLATSAITGSAYNSTCTFTNYCYFNTTGTIPANTTVKEISIYITWSGSSPCYVSDGAARPVIGTCVPPVLSVTSGAYPGYAYGTVYMISTSYIPKTCYAAPACTDQSINLGYRLYRSCKGSTAAVCTDATCIGPYSPIVYTITAHTVEFANSPSISVDPTAFCIGNPLKFRANVHYGVPSYNYSWSLTYGGSPIASGLGLDSLSYTFATSGNQKIYCAIQDNCGNTINDSTTIYINPLPIISGSSAVCVGQNITLTGSGTPAVTSPWLSSNTSIATVDASGVVAGIGGGTTTITYTNSSGCTATKNITVNRLPTPTMLINETSGVANNDSIICKGATITLTEGSGTGTAVWSTGATTSSISVSPTSTTKYTVKLTNSAGCIDSVSRTMTVNNLPLAGINVSESSGTTNNDGVICSGATVSLLGSGGTSYLWSTGATSSTILVSPSSTTTYLVTVTDANKCSSSTSQTITVNPLPSPTVSVYETSSLSANDGTICRGDSVRLEASAASGYTWSTGSTSSSITVYPTSTTTYSVTVKDVNYCNGLVSQTINVRALPTASTSVIESSGVANNDAILCVGDTVIIIASGGVSYLWSTSDATSSISVAPLVSSSYNVKVTDAYQCSSSTIRNIVVKNRPSKPIVVSPLNLCKDVPASALSATGMNLKWYYSALLGTSYSSIIPKTDSVGTKTYYVSQTNSDACEGSRESLVVNVNPSPSVNIISGSPYGFIYCKNLTVLLKGIAPTAKLYLWDSSGVAISSRDKDTTSVGTMNKWGLTVWNTFGCKNRAEVMVYKDSSKLPTLSPTELKICEEGSALLTCHPGFVSYTFEYMKENVIMMPLSLKSNLRNVNLPGIYTVRVTNNYGCIDTTNAAILSYYPRPIKPSIVVTKPKLEVANIYRYYQWYFNNKALMGSNDYYAIAKTSGSYFVEVTDSNGCINNSDTVLIELPTQIAQVQLEAIKIYPNPTHNWLTIEAPVDIDIIMTDLVGRVVLNSHIPKTISLDRLSSGTYLLKIFNASTKEFIGIEKIIKID